MKFPQGGALGWIKNSCVESITLVDGNYRVTLKDGNIVLLAHAPTELLKKRSTTKEELDDEKSDDTIC